MAISVAATFISTVAGDRLRNRREQQSKREAEDLREQLERANKALQQAREEQLALIENFEIQLFIDVNPLMLTDEDHKKLLSKELVKALEDEQKRGIELPVELYDPIVEEMLETYGVVRRSVFKRWELNITLDHLGETEGRFSHDTGIRLQMEDGLESFVISHVSGDERAAVQCWLVYRFPSNRRAGFRTFKDFNGAYLGFSLEANPEILDLTTVRMHMEAGGGVKPLFVQSEKFEEKGGGCWRGRMQIPVDYF